MLHSNLTFAALFMLLAAGCGETVTPADPLLGTWRSDEYAITYPSSGSDGTAVEEITIAADGSMTFLITRRYPVSASNPYSGCTWTERHPDWRWIRLDGASMFAFGPVSGSNAQVWIERTGCTDPTQNRPLHGAPDDTVIFAPFFDAADYSIAGNRLTLSLRHILAPINDQRVVRQYSRIR